MRLKIARIYEKIANARLAFLHQLSWQIVRDYDIICLETLNVKGMMANKKLAKPFNYNPNHRSNRQEISKDFKENGAIYITKYQNFLKKNNQTLDKIKIIKDNQIKLINELISNVTVFTYR